MRHKTSQILFEYWDDLRAGRRAPERIEIDPARIAEILPETMMLEATKPGSYRFRIAGTRICEWLGMELRGLNFLALWSPADQRYVEHRLRELAQTGRTTSLMVNSTTSDGRPVTSEIIILPLANAVGEITRYMGAWSMAAPTEWAGTRYLTDHQLTDAQAAVTTPERPRDALRPDPAPPSLVTNPAFKRIVTSNRRRFRVYDGGLS
jgi:hypothetical protein